MIISHVIVISECMTTQTYLHACIMEQGVYTNTCIESKFLIIHACCLYIVKSIACMYGYIQLTCHPELGDAAFDLCAVCINTIC